MRVRQKLGANEGDRVTFSQVSGDLTIILGFLSPMSRSDCMDNECGHVLTIRVHRFFASQELLSKLVKEVTAQHDQEQKQVEESKGLLKTLISSLNLSEISMRLLTVKARQALFAKGIQLEHK